MKLVQLVATMNEKKINRVQLADDLGITYNALTKRILGYVEFDLSEIREIIKILNLTDEEIRRCFYLN